MANVTVHHTVEEWEGDYGQESGVGFQVPWNAVGVDHVLEDIGEFVSLDISWRSDLVLFDVSSDGSSSIGVHLLEDQVLLVSGGPKVAHKGVVDELKLVEGLEHGFLPCEEHLEDVQGGGGVVVVFTLNAVKLR